MMTKVESAPSSYSRYRDRGFSADGTIVRQGNSGSRVAAHSDGNYVVTKTKSSGSWRLIGANGLSSTKNFSGVRVVKGGAGKSVAFQRIYSGAHSVQCRPAVRNDRFAQLRKKIRSLGELAKGWDTYDAEPIAASTIEQTLELASALNARGILPEWVTATSDSTILLQWQNNGLVSLWEIYPDREMAVTVRTPFNPPEFIGVMPGETGCVLEKLIDRDAWK